MSATLATSDTSGAAAKGRIAALATTNLTALKTGPGNIYSIFVASTAAAAATVFLKLYDKASAPVLASDVPVLTIPIISTTTTAGWIGMDCDVGMAFKLGIAYAITGGIADTDATAVAAGAVHGCIFYK